MSFKRIFKRNFFILNLASMSANFQKLIIWIGPKSENVSLRVMSVVAKFHAFIINLNNSVFFWSITAGL